MLSFCDLSPLYRAINAVEQELSQTYGLVINEAMILCLLKDETLPAGVINERLLLTPTHSSKLIRSLEAKGFIMRNVGAEDKRKMYFSLTAGGMNKLQEIKHLSEQLFETIKTEIAKLK